MGSFALRTDLTRDGEPVIDLETAFKHPQGLQTARKIINSLWAKQQQRSAQSEQPQQAHQLSPDDISSALAFDASPEVASLLRNILEFSVSEPQNQSFDERHMGTSTSFTPFVEEGALPASIAPSYAEEGHRRSASNTPSHNIDYPPRRNHLAQPKPASCTGLKGLQSSSAFRQLRSPEAPFDYEIDSIFGPVVSNQTSTPGTESPYRVESPASHLSHVGSSKSPSQQLGEKNRHSPAQYPGHESSLNRGISMRTGLSTASKHVQSSSTSLFGESSGLRNATSTHQPANTVAEITAIYSPYATAKKASGSFLAVNKSIETEGTLGLEKARPNQDHRQNLSTTPRQGSPTIGSLSYTANSGLGLANSPLSLRSPSPNIPPSTHQPTPHNNFIRALSSPSNTPDPEGSDLEMLDAEKLDRGKALSKATKTGKRKSELTSTSLIKKARRAPKTTEKGKSARHRVPSEIWLRIFEFCPPSFFKKARFVCKTFKGWVDALDSVSVNNRKANYGLEMPPPPPGMTEAQYRDLFGGKGCMEPDCQDKKSSRTHWTWEKRWCLNCWKSKITRDDKALKDLGHRYDRPTSIKLLECIPAGMHDAYMKPHDYIDNVETRTPGSTRLYKCYLSSAIPEIIADYEALTPAPYVEDPNHTQGEKAAALAAHKVLMDALPEKRTEFFAKRKAITDEKQSRIQMIEALIRNKRERDKNPNDKNRNGRKELFTRRAKEDLPHIPITFVHETACYKAAVRIFRDAGTERGWLTLKPKIEKLWEENQDEANAPKEPQEDVDNDVDDTDDENTMMMMSHQPLSRPGPPASLTGTQHHMFHSVMHQRANQHGFEAASMNMAANGFFHASSNFGLNIMSGTSQPQFHNTGYSGSFNNQNNIGLPGAFPTSNARHQPDLPSNGYWSPQHISPANSSHTQAHEHSQQRVTQISISSLLQPQPPSSVQHYNPYQ